MRRLYSVLLLAGVIAGLFVASGVRADVPPQTPDQIVAAQIARLPPGDVARAGAVRLVPRATLQSMHRCGETWLFARPLILVALPDDLCPAWWLSWVVRHEVGHVVCWQTAGDLSETCAETYAGRHP